jgi:hypothetical protein
MGTERDYTEYLVVTLAEAMPYEWSVGLWGSVFFQGIKEHGRFTGIRCQKCGTVYVPPRRVCGPCFAELNELLPLSDTGTIVAFSTVNYPFIDPATGRQRPIPYTYGYIRIDGADNIFSHIINETDVSKIRVGMKVRAKFRARDEMQGNIQDIRYFDIVE